VTIAYTQGTSTTQLVAPFFILMATLLGEGQITRDIYGFLSRHIKRIPGNLGIATTLTATIFAALCGSSSATAATLGMICVPQMIERGYKKHFAAGITGAGGTLGIMIPPSIAFIIYGIITETSIVKLFMAGILPGIIISFFLCSFIAIRAKLSPSLVNSGQNIKVKEENEEEAKSHTIPFLMSLALVAVLLVSMYMGIVTPTEAGAVGATGAFIIVCVLKRINLNMTKKVLKSSTRVSCMIMFLIIAGMSLTFLSSSLGIPQQAAGLIETFQTSKWLVIAGCCVLWIVLGVLLDPTSMVVITMPFIFPVLTGLGFDPLWIGVVSTVLVEIGMLTPPVGLNIFVLRAVTGVSLEDIIKGSLPFIFILIITVIMLCIFPQIVLFIPSHM